MNAIIARLLSVALTAAAASAAAADFFVAPNGHDANPGTPARPFATLERARDAVRELKKAGALREPVNVRLAGGTYTLAREVRFGPEDSGAAACPITYTAAGPEPAVLDGGRRITGWQKHDARLWVVTLPEVASGQWRFRQLYVNGQPRARARTPNQGFFRVAGCPEGTPKTVNYHKDCQTFQFKPGDIRADWTNLSDVEVIVYHFWTDSHLPIQSVDTRSNLVTFAHKAGKTFTDDFTEDGARYIVENVFEGLDAPGEWYLNRRSGRLFYYPLDGEDPQQLEVVAPYAPAHLRLEGNPADRRYVEHLRFRDLSLAYSNFEFRPGDSNDRQGSATVPAAVTLRGARSCVFERCHLSRLGTFAFEVMAGCSENQFVGNEIARVAAGGIRVNGGTDRNPPWERTRNNQITDNWLHHYGQDFPSAVGVLLMNTEGNAVAHNHIHDGGYTGVSVGWVWGYQRSVSQNNRIEFNHIHHLGGVLSDMGGIYTLGVSPGTLLRNNHIHDVDANHYGGWGIYHDEGSTHLLVENNVVHHTKFAPFNIHFAKEVTVRNNIFALGKLEQASRGRNEPHKSVFFENNIVYWREGELFSKNWKDVPYAFHFHPKDKKGTATATDTFDCDWNLYFNPGRKLEEVTFNGATWAEWQKRGKDPHSRYADPMFVAPEQGDFTLKPESPALTMGFQPVDLSRVGPRIKTGPVFAQKAAPADRAAARPGGMMADSPVTFPKQGALPAKFPPDVKEQSEPAEKDYYIFSSPCRSLAQIAAIQKEMPRGRFAPPPPDWPHLPRTRRILTEGGDLRLLALGDSIVNDTMRSGWVALLQEAYPKARIQATVYVRGGGGCQHYREEGRVAKYILPRKPDLLFIGGISQKNVDSIREVIRQARAGLPDVEILLATGAFGTADPRDAAALAQAPHSGTGPYGQSLKALAADERCAYLDMTTPWAEYIRSANVHPHLFYRDVVHANEYGEQILAKVLVAFFSPSEK